MNVQYYRHLGAAVAGLYDALVASATSCDPVPTALIHVATMTPVRDVSFRAAADAEDVDALIQDVAAIMALPLFNLRALDLHAGAKWVGGGHIVSVAEAARASPHHGYLRRLRLAALKSVTFRELQRLSAAFGGLQQLRTLRAVVEDNGFFLWTILCRGATTLMHSVVIGELALTPLMRAAAQGLCVTARRLVADGADVNEAATGGRTPLHLAAFNGQGDMVDQLIALRCEPNPSYGPDGANPVIAAAIGGHRTSLKRLLEHGADIEARTTAGWTPLMYAALYGHIPLSHFLLEHGCNVKCRTNAGGTPAMMAVNSLNGDVRGLEVLLKYGCEVNVATTGGWTALMLAARSGHLAMVRCLVEHGADLDARTRSGFTALRWAENSNHTEVVAYLTEVLSRADELSRL
jgi:ankyrin repeat protein